MLGSLLTNVASYFSKYFFATAYLPILIFSLLNGFLADFFIEPFHDWIREQLAQNDSLTKSVFGVSVIALITLVVAFAYSGLLDFLRRLLEGQWWQPVRRLFLPLHEMRLRRLQDRIEAISRERDKLRSADEWKDKVRTARKATASRVPLDIGKAPYTNLVAAIDEANTLQMQGRRPDPDALESMFTQLARLFDAYDDPALTLGSLNGDLARLVEYSVRSADAEHMRLVNELHTSFGDELAPTRMGNVANAMQAYAVRHYNCNLGLFWTSLQVCITAPAKDVLQDSKAKLDFMVASVWLAIATTAVWVPLLRIGDAAAFTFVVFSILAPICCWIGYLAAVEQYRAFADIVTTCIDLHRFDLLRALKVALPADLQDERALWDELHCLTSSNLEFCERQNIRYVLARSS